MNKSIYMCFLALGLAITPAYATEKDPAEKVSLGALATGPDKHTAAIQADIVDLMLAKKDSVIGGTGEATYKDNLNSTRENQNKIKSVNDQSENINKKQFMTMKGASAPSFLQTVLSSFASSQYCP